MKDSRQPAYNSKTQRRFSMDLRIKVLTLRREKAQGRQRSTSHHFLRRKQGILKIVRNNCCKTGVRKYYNDVNALG
jgi:hypothetical protein